MFRSLFGHVSRWKERICYALVDQACSSASSLVLTVLVARSVPIESFGAYALVWFISMSCDTICNSLVNDPMPAIFSEKQQKSRSKTSSPRKTPKAEEAESFQNLLAASTPRAAAGSTAQARAASKCPDRSHQTSLASWMGD